MPPFKKEKAKLDYAALRKRVSENGADRLYLLWGEEDYLLRDFVNLIRAGCVTEETAAFDARRIDSASPELSDVEEALNAMPFFGGRTFLELRGFDINSCKDEGLLELLTDIPDWCTVVITLPPEKSPDGRLAHIKKLKSCGTAVEFTAQEERVLFQWMSQRFKAHGKKVSRDAMERLLFLSGELMTRLIPEIEKVAGYAEGDTVTAEDVNAVAHHIPEAQTFEMTDCIAARDFDGAVRILAELMAGDTSPVEIMGLLSWQLRQLYGVKLCEKTGRGAAFFREVTGSSDFMIRKYAASAKRFSLEALRSGLRLSAELLKKTREGGAYLTDEDAVKEFLIRFSWEAQHA